MQKLVFFFPWEEVSGGPFYLARLANELAKKKLYEVYYTDYPHGLCESLIKHRAIKILKYNNEGKKYKIFPKEPIVLVMPVYWANMVPKIHPDSKIVFFNWHNECIPVLKRDWQASSGFINKFLRLVRDTSSVFFCDKTHWMAQNQNDIIFKETYVPVVIPTRKIKSKTEIIKRKTRNIAVLGRLCIDKVYAVLDLLDNIEDLRDYVKTNVYVIGEGDYESLVFDRKYPSYIKIIRCGTMDIKDVVKLLSEKVDILFAMGTSVLEGATIALPSVIIPNDIKAFQCNKYPYIFETEGYSLGWYPEQIELLNLKTHTIEQIFDDIFKYNKKSQIGQKCYEYYLQNHHNNIDLFIDAIYDSKLTYKIYKDFLYKNWNINKILHAIWAKLKEYHGKTCSRFSILGFPLYTRSKTNEYHTNIYVCCLPLLRINKFGNKIGVYFLPLVWSYKAGLKIFQYIRKKIKGEEK